MKQPIQTCNVKNLSSRAVHGVDVNGAPRVAENLGACHQDWKFMYRAQHISEAKNLRSNCAVPCVDIAFNDVDASGCLWEEKQNEHIDTETSRLTTTDPSNAHSSM